MKLLLIRHGQTDINGTGYMHKIHDPVSLNDTGKKQAKALVPILEMHQVEAIYSSPERRAIDTAETLSASLNIPVITTPNLEERNFGELQKLPYREIKEKLDALSIEKRYLFKPPGGESWEEMDKRLQLFLKEIKKKSYASIAMVTHEGVLRALITLINQEPKEKSLEKHFDNGSCSVIEI